MEPCANNDIEGLDLTYIKNKELRHSYSLDLANTRSIAPITSGVNRSTISSAIMFSRTCSTRLAPPTRQRPRRLTGCKTVTTSQKIVR